MRQNKIKAVSYSYISRSIKDLSLQSFRLVILYESLKFIVNIHQFLAEGNLLIIFF